MGPKRSMHCFASDFDVYFKSLVGKHGKYASDDFEKTIPSDYLLDCYRNSSAKSAGIRTNKDFDYKYSELFLLEKKNYIIKALGFF